MDGMFNSVKEEVMEHFKGGKKHGSSNVVEREYREDDESYSAQGGRSTDYYDSNVDSYDRRRDDYGYNNNTSSYGGGYGSSNDDYRERDTLRDTVSYEDTVNDQSRGYGRNQGRNRGYDDYDETTTVTSTYDDDSYGSGGREYRSQQGGGLPGGYGSYDAASSYAQQHFGPSGHASIFSNAAQYIGGRDRELESETFDESSFIRCHREIYENQGYGGQRSVAHLAQAAAMHALKYLVHGKGGSQNPVDQNEYVGMAMAEGARLYDSQDSMGYMSSDVSRQELVNQTARMASKLYLQSNLDSAGFGSGGGGSGLFSMGSRFF